MSRLIVWLLAAANGISPAAVPTPRPAAELSEPERAAAIAALHRRAESTSPGAPEARRVSAELEEMAEVYLDGGEAGRAIELLEEAFALDASNGAALAGLALAYARADDLEAAAFYLGVAEERAGGGPPEPYVALGEILYGAHRLDDAIAAWSQAVRLGGQDPALLRRLARVRDEVAVTRGQRSLSTQHFVVFAEPSVPDALVQRVADALEAAHAAQSSFFGAPLAARQVVVLYGGRAFFALASVPDWVSGVYDGKIRIALRPDGTEPESLSGVLAHELAHALTRQVSRDRAPAWLHEGLAQWLEGRRLTRDELHGEAGRQAARSIEDLEQRLPGPMSRAQARVLYAQTLSLVEYLAAVRGEGALACLVWRLNDGASLAEALRTETGWTSAELYSGWKSWADS